MKRSIALLLFAGACEDRPVLTDALAFPVLAEEVVIISGAPIAGGAATATVEFAPLFSAWGTSPSDERPGRYHLEAQIRYTGAMLGGRNEGDFVPYLGVQLAITNRDNEKAYTVELLPVVGVAEGWHYATDAELETVLGPSEAGYDVMLTIQPAADVVIHSDLLDSLQGTFLGSDDLLVSGFFTLEDLAAPAKEGTAKDPSKKAGKPKAPGGGYGY